MTIKEYTVTEEILTYKRAYDTINSEEIKNQELKSILKFN